MFNDIDELKDLLICEAEYEEDEIECMSNYDLFDAWLTYNHFDNCADNILNVINVIYGTEF